MIDGDILLSSSACLSPVRLFAHDLDIGHKLIH